MGVLIMRYSAIILSFLGFYTQPAFADWQYTKWGMTANEVIAASGKKVFPELNPGTDKGDSKVKLRGTHVSESPYEQFQFDASFYFGSSEKLQDVVLDLKDSEKCPNLAGAMLTIYGPAQVEDRSSVSFLRTWWDRLNDNHVSYLRIGNKCSVTYKEMVKPGAKGL